VCLAAAGLMLGGAATGRAIERPTADPMVLASATINETGFTLGNVLSHNLWTLAKHPLARQTLSAVTTAVHQAPRRGIQVELLTPGDFGATLHIRW
jgi:hypothetical protein